MRPTTTLLVLVAALAAAAPAHAAFADLGATAATDPVVAVAGDIACDPADSSFRSGYGTASRCRQRATSNLIYGNGYTAVLTTGDIQYECGGYGAFLRSFDPSWGRFKRRIRPAPGNHEYYSAGGTDCDSTGNAGGYFRYFGAAAGAPALGYYSFDLGGWHLVALNSNCGEVGGCGAGSPQETWLRKDLAATSKRCILAFWHHPRFSSGSHGNTTAVAPFWRALYEARADVVLNGHDHDYERFYRQTPRGVFSVNGIREFVVGTGGKSLRAFSTIRRNSAARSSSSFGILRLTLRPTGYGWRFVPANGSFADQGSTSCH